MVDRTKRLGNMKVSMCPCPWGGFQEDSLSLMPHLGFLEKNKGRVLVASDLAFWARSIQQGPRPISRAHEEVTPQ